MDTYIRDIKRFNRFYIRVNGLLSMYTDKSSYSAIEALILFEIKEHENCTANYISRYSLLDKGYVSRILKRFEKKGVVKKAPSVSDRRVKHLNLTDKGVTELINLQDEADSNVREMTKDIPDQNLIILINSMKNIEELLTQKEMKV